MILGNRKATKMRKLFDNQRTIRQDSWETTRRRLFFSHSAIADRPRRRLGKWKSWRRLGSDHDEKIFRLFRTSNDTDFWHRSSVGRTSPREIRRNYSTSTRYECKLSCQVGIVQVRNTATKTRQTRRRRPIRRWTPLFSMIRQKRDKNTDYFYFDIVRERN